MNREITSACIQQDAAFGTSIDRRDCGFAFSTVTHPGDCTLASGALTGSP